MSDHSSPDLEIRVYAMGPGEASNEFLLASFDSADFFDVQLLECIEATGEINVLKEYEELKLEQAGVVSDQLHKEHPEAIPDWIEYT